MQHPAFEYTPVQLGVGLQRVLGEYEGGYRVPLALPRLLIDYDLEVRQLAVFLQHRAQILVPTYEGQVAEEEPTGVHDQLGGSLELLLGGGLGGGNGLVGGGWGGDFEHFYLNVSGVVIYDIKGGYKG